MCSAAYPLIRRHMTKSAHHFTLASLAVVASVLLARRATGQEAQRPPNAAPPAAVADSLPFRAGQWGAEFAINDGTIGLGVLRFRSARKAWLLDASVGASWSDIESSFSAEHSARSVFARARAGPRRYRPIATGSAAYLGMGLTGSYGWATSDDTRAHTWDAGVFGELGAVYFVTRRLSLGAQVEVSGSFSESHRRYSNPPGGFRDRRVSIGVRPVRIVGALYF
jgi:hypothetical protein